MGATRNTGYIENLIAYDGNNNIGVGGPVNVLYKVTIGGNTLISGNLNVTGTITFSSNVTANSFVKNGGVATEFLKADGTVDTSTYATVSYVDTSISNLIDAAPAALNTLNELAAALGDDSSFSTTVTTALGNRLRIDTDAQGLTSEQKANGRTNLGVVIGTDVQAYDADLGAIAALTGTSGLLKKTAANTWTLDTNTYVTGGPYLPLTGGTLTGALSGTTYATGASGYYELGYGADAASRSWRIKNDELDNGDLNIMQSTTRTGATYSTKFRIKPTGKVTFGDGTTTAFEISGGGSFSAAISGTSATFSSSVNGQSFSVVPATNYNAQFDYTGGVRISQTTPSTETSDNMTFTINGGSTSTTGNAFIFKTQTGNITPSTVLTIAKTGAASFTGSVTVNNALMVSGNVPNLLTVQNNAATNYTTAYIAQTVQGGNGNQNIGLLVDVQGASANDRIANFRYFNQGGTPISVLSVTRGAGVGIYQQSPEAGLDVNTDVRIRSFLRVDSGINYTSGILNLTGASQQWCKMGTVSISQGGHTCLITLVGGAGYNADENQNGIAEIFLRTSNGSPNGSGWYISGWLNVRGFSTAFISGAVLVQNSATSYDVYVQMGTYSGNTYYRIEGSNITWSASASVYGASAPAGSLTLTNSFRVASQSHFFDNVRMGSISGGSRPLNVAYGIGVRTNLTGTEQEIFHIGNTGSGVNDGFMRLFDNGTAKVLIAANNARGGHTYFNGGGNVAIGTDDASCKLRVEGGEIRVTSGNVGIAMYNTSGNGELASYNWAAGSWIDQYYSAASHIFRLSGSGSYFRIRPNGVVDIGQGSDYNQVWSGSLSFSSGWREIFRTNSVGLCTSGRFTITGTGNSYVHASQWAWSSTHNGGTGRARLIQLTGGEYSDISFAIDTTTGGSVVISCNSPIAVTYQITIEKTIGTNLDLSQQNADRTSAPSGYSRVQTITSIPYGSQVYKLIAENDVVAFSDAKLKTNVKTIDNALNKVLSLRGVSYNRIDIEQDVNRIGVIAQEVQNILPEVITNSGDTLGVSYGNMVGVLIEAIKEQQKQIEELKSQIKNK